LRFSISGGSLGNATRPLRQALKPVSASHLRHFRCPRSVRNAAQEPNRRPIEPFQRSRRLPRDIKTVFASPARHDIAALAS
jgi:hypothetical protein